MSNEALLPADNRNMALAAAEDLARHPSTIAIARFFASDHLPQPLRDISAQCDGLAALMIRHTEGPELTAGLRHLLEAKDCFVRAAL